MKALVKKLAKPGLWLEDVPVPEIEPDDSFWLVNCKPGFELGPTPDKSSCGWLPAVAWVRSVPTSWLAPSMG